MTAHALPATNPTATTTKEHVMIRHLITATASAAVAATLAVVGTLAVVDHRAETSRTEFAATCTDDGGRIRTMYPHEVVAAYADGNRLAVASSELVDFCIGSQVLEP